MKKQVEYCLSDGSTIYDDKGKYKLDEIIYYGFSNFLGRTRKGRRVGEQCPLYYRARVVGIKTR